MRRGKKKEETNASPHTHEVTQVCRLMPTLVKPTLAILKTDFGQSDFGQPTLAKKN